MNLFIKIKSLFRKQAGEFEIWDTSAISTWYDVFQAKIKEGINIIVPEGVLGELSAGRRSYERCREAYKLINNSPEINVYLTPDNMKSWSVDQQVVTIATKYYMKGYITKLITCDCDQARQARDRGVSVELLKGNREVAKTSEQRSRQPQPETKGLEIPCVKQGDKAIIRLNTGMAVYGQKGRKIGKNGVLVIEKNDTFFLNEEAFKVTRITENSILFEKMDGT